MEPAGVGVTRAGMTRTPNILLAGLFQETNGFLDQTTAWSDFKVFRGADVFQRRGDGSVTDGFLGEAEKHGFRVVPALDVWASPGGKVEDAAFEHFWREFEAVARPALHAGVDAIFLVLHGAMATVSEEDPEGEFLRRIRELPGAAKVPIVGVLDLHANVTEAMCLHANVLVTYRENPHIDAKQTGERATVLMARCLAENRVPHMSWCRPPLVWTPPATGTQSDPMLSLERYARDVEDSNSDIWVFNVAAGFSFADTSETGVTLSVVSVAPKETDHRVLEDGARLAWELRHLAHVNYPPADDVVTRLLQKKRTENRPVLLIEPSDNVGAGAPGDGTGTLRSLLRHRVQSAVVVINDPLAVAALNDAAVGDQLGLSIGGKGSSLDPGPVELRVVLVSRSKGSFKLEDPQSHLAAMSGTTCEMGASAVVQTDGVTILLTSQRTPPFDLGQLRSQGIEPTQYAFIVVKAAIAHKRAYDPIAAAAYYVGTPGPCDDDISVLPWKRLNRPVWPLDPIESFSCKIS